MSNSAAFSRHNAWRVLRYLAVVALLSLSLVAAFRLTPSAQSCSECQPRPEWGTPISGNKKVCFDGSIPTEEEREIKDGGTWWNERLTTREPQVYFNYAAPGDMSNCNITIGFDYGMVGDSRPARSIVSQSGNNSVIYFNPSQINNGYNFVTYTSAHEFYHVLGFDDLPENMRGPCDGYSLMAGVYTGHPGLPGDFPCGDMAALQSMYVPQSGVNCATDPGHPDCSPLVIDTKGNGFNFTRARGGVMFDIDADGEREQIGWTQKGSDDAWLAMDRNGNGAIDNGTELFGNVTPGCGDQARGSVANGFEALKLLEQACFGASVQDGIIDENDAVFERLLLWRDLNHDGVSTADELVRVRDSPLRAIHTDYVLIERVRKGNAIRQASIVIWGDARRSIVDVWLDTIEPETRHAVYPSGVPLVALTTGPLRWIRLTERLLCAAISTDAPWGTH